MGLVYNEAFIWNRRKDLTGVTLRYGSLTYPPHIYLLDPINETHFKTLDGTFGSVWKELQLNLNFSYLASKSSDGIWSYRQSNGTWLGLFGMLQRNEIDFAIGAGYTLERSKEFSPTVPVVGTP